MTDQYSTRQTRKFTKLPLQGQEPDNALRDWRSGVLDIFLPLASLAIFPLVVQIVLQLRDLLTLILPAFTRLMDDFDFVSDFGAMESIHPSQEIIAKQVYEVMEAPVCVDVSCGLSRAFALLHHHNLTDLPVVDKENCLVGIVSRVDVGTAILKNWEIVSGD